MFRDTYKHSNTYKGQQRKDYNSGKKGFLIGEGIHKNFWIGVNVLFLTRVVVKWVFSLELFMSTSALFIFCMLYFKISLKEGN